MPKTFSECKSDVHDLLGVVITEEYPELAEHGVGFDLVFAYAATDQEGIATGAAIYDSNKQPVESKTMIAQADDRALNRPLVKIAIDGNYWGDSDEREQYAVLDAALARIEIVTENEVVTHPPEPGKKRGRKEVTDNVVAVYEDDGKVKLKIRTPDYSVTGYYAVLDRHLTKSAEYNRALQYINTFPQNVLRHRETYENNVASAGQLPGGETET
jgi:hypothetical protein